MGAKDKIKSDSAFSDFSASFIEKAWELRWGVKLTYVVLALDLALALIAKKTVFSLALTPKGAWEHFGLILGGIAAFSLLVSIIIPFVGGFVRVVGCFAPWEKLESDREDELPRGYVYLSSLVEHAVRENNDFAWAICRERREMYDQIAKQKSEIGLLVFGLVFLVVSNAIVGYISGVKTIGVELALYGGAPSWAFILLVVVWILREAWWGRWVREIAYYPPLADEQAHKKEKARKEELKWLRELD
ncbi:hypothetical protein AAZU54_03680 [Pseudomonas sp. Je.1.5.c]|uniref:hypothetical protein n=1 Tax=Pseudomonas sp. Je.1.5.c TaxID=3142839 RepID=UPI003DAA33D7